MPVTLRLATRGSDLAVRQAASVRERLSSGRHEVELVEVSTRGDEVRDELIHRLGKTGAFVRALDERVLDGGCDAAVHSMKDVPTEESDLIVAGVPKRAAPGDVLVTPDGRSLEDLPAEAVVGTSSLRRRAQLLAERPDLTVEPLRGNVDTRVEKLLAPSLQREHERRLAAEEAEQESGYDQAVGEWFDALAEIERQALGREVETEYDAIVLAEAGLKRSDLLEVLSYERLPVERFVPSPGQGAIAVTARDDDVGDLIHQRMDDSRTRVETSVERTVLAELGGGCIAPVGIHAVIEGRYVRTIARVLDRDGIEEVHRTRDLPVERHVEAAKQFAADLAENGAADLIQQARRTNAPDREAREDREG